MYINISHTLSNCIQFSWGILRTTYLPKKRLPEYNTTLLLKTIHNLTGYRGCRRFYELCDNINDKSISQSRICSWNSIQICDSKARSRLSFYHALAWNSARRGKIGDDFLIFSCVEVINLNEQSTPYLFAKRRQKIRSVHRWLWATRADQLFSIRDRYHRVEKIPCYFIVRDVFHQTNHEMFTV